MGCPSKNVWARRINLCGWPARAQSKVGLHMKTDYASSLSWRCSRHQGVISLMASERALLQPFITVSNELLGGIESNRIHQLLWVSINLLVNWRGRGGVSWIRLLTLMKERVVWASKSGLICYIPGYDSQRICFPHFVPVRKPSCFTGVFFLLGCFGALLTTLLEVYLTIIQNLG